MFVSKVEARPTNGQFSNVRMCCLLPNLYNELYVAISHHIQLQFHPFIHGKYIKFYSNVPSGLACLPQGNTRIFMGDQSTSNNSKVKNDSDKRPLCC